MIPFVETPPSLEEPKKLIGEAKEQSEQLVGGEQAKKEQKKKKKQSGSPVNGETTEVSLNRIAEKESLVNGDPIITCPESDIDEEENLIAEKAELFDPPWSAQLGRGDSKSRSLVSAFGGVGRSGYSNDDFNFLKVLGEGGFGKVLLTEWKGQNKFFAIKAVKKCEVKEAESVFVERRVLSLACGHPFLTHLFCTYQSKDHLFFVMEYLNGGNLSFHIQSSGRFTEQRTKFYAAEIALGLIYLHGNGIAHRDLKLENILLDCDGHIKIADFGMCRENISDQNKAYTICGTPDYMAPEILQMKEYTYAVDWWSYGVILFKMMSGQFPFPVEDSYKETKSPPIYPKWMPKDCIACVKELLQKEPEKRLGDPRKHDFFKTIDFRKLEKREIDPPFKPKIQSPSDYSNFDECFLSEKPKLTMNDRDVIENLDQGLFKDFSFVSATEKDC